MNYCDRYWRRRMSLVYLIERPELPKLSHLQTSVCICVKAIYVNLRYCSCVDQNNDIVITSYCRCVCINDLSSVNISHLFPPTPTPAVKINRKNIFSSAFSLAITSTCNDHPLKLSFYLFFANNE